MLTTAQWTSSHKLQIYKAHFVLQISELAVTLMKYYIGTGRFSSTGKYYSSFMQITHTVDASVWQNKLLIHMIYTGGVKCYKIFTFFAIF